MVKPQSRAPLVRILAELYPDEDSIRRLLDFAGLPTGLIKMSRRPMDTWFSAVSEADVRARRSDLLKVVLLEHPENADLHLLLNEELQDTGRLSDGPVPGADTEKIMGAQSTLLPVSFFAKGLAVSRSVGKIVTATHVGTGFLVGGDRLVTNNHVLPTADIARGATVICNFQHGLMGQLLETAQYALRPDLAFVTSAEDDLTVVGVDAQACRDWGTIHVDPAGPEPARVNIVQHPGGGPKQIAVHHNVVSHMDERVIHYYTDTLPGSSGSPLFDDDWRLVGVHHAGGRFFSPSQKRSVFTNEGIPVSRLARLLER